MGVARVGQGREVERLGVCLCGQLCKSLAGDSVRLQFSKLPGQFTGTGDLFTALLLAWMHQGLQVSPAHSTQACPLGPGTVYDVCCVIRRWPVRRPLRQCRLSLNGPWTQLRVCLLERL